MVRLIVIGELIVQRQHVGSGQFTGGCGFTLYDGKSFDPLEWTQTLFC
jgi:hypothetical protein